MTTRSRCAVCDQEAYRDRNGRMMLHTRTIYSVLDKRAVVCEGSDKGARA